MTWVCIPSTYSPERAGDCSQTCSLNTLQLRLANSKTIPEEFFYKDSLTEFYQSSQFGITLCIAIFYSRPHTGNMRKKNKQEYIYGSSKTCLICGQIFIPRDSDRETYVPKYCSYACNNKSRRIHKKISCKQCNSKFVPYRKGHLFCSKKCSGSYRVDHYVQDPMVPIRRKIASRCCDMINRCLRGKNGRSREILGYTPRELIEHLEKYFLPGMHWGNYGNTLDSWSIDHTKPISKFGPSATIREINALSNLRPMWHSDNCAKRNHWEGQ